MARLRLRHPKGVSTLEIDLDAISTTVQDLLSQIFAITEIPPSQQELRHGYPPQPLEAVVPELPISSLGIKPGDQLIVTQKQGPPTVPTHSRLATAPAQPSAPAAPPAPFSSPIPAASTGDSDASRPNAPDYVRVDGGYLVHRVVPDDNSCMFASVAIALERDQSKAASIRKIVGEAIKADPERWNEAILGRPPAEYISTITSPKSWGGAIELSILASHYSTEIASIDVETGRVDRFEPSGGVSSGNRVLLIYSGIHYDAAVLSPELGASDEWSASVFSIAENPDRDPMLLALQELAGKLKKKHMYTNTATFDIRCEDCGKGLRGEKEAREHASQTGHVRFGEYS